MYLRRLLLVTALVSLSALPALAQFNDPILDGEYRSRMRQLQENEARGRYAAMEYNARKQAEQEALIRNVAIVGVLLAGAVGGIVLYKSRNKAKQQAPSQLPQTPPAEDLNT